MPFTQMGLVRTLHVLSAAIALGALATGPLLRARLEGAEDSRWAVQGLAFLGDVERRVLWPATLGVLVFGLGMVEGPIAAFSFTAPGAGWLHIGATLWMLLAAAVALAWHSRQGLEDQAREGATGGDRVATLWRRWTLATWTGALVLVGGIAVMGMKIGA